MLLEAAAHVPGPLSARVDPGALQEAAGRFEVSGGGRVERILDPAAVKNTVKLPVQPTLWEWRAIGASHGSRSIRG